MELKIGDKVPHFTAKDTNGENFDSKSIVGRQAVVLYFYPKDDTKVCTDQACSFRDQYEDFKELGAEIIGVSGDTITAHKKFSTKYKLPFILLSDSSKKLRKLFGVPSDLFGLIPGRVTYVIDNNGILVYIFNSMSGKIHITKALAFLKKMK